MTVRFPLASWPRAGRASAVRTTTKKTAVRTRFPESWLKTGKELPIFFILPPEVGRRHERKCGHYIRPQLQSLGQTDSYQVCSERRVMGPESNSDGACAESGNRSRLLGGVIRLRDGSSAAAPLNLKKLACPLTVQ